MLAARKTGTRKDRLRTADFQFQSRKMLHGRKTRFENTEINVVDVVGGMATISIDVGGIGSQYREKRSARTLTIHKKHFNEEMFEP
jgi:hypothetical protein